METVQDTPAKKRMENGYVPASCGYNSQDDSGDELIKEFQDYETVATVPLPPKVALEHANDTYTLTTQAQHDTQPTQIINRTPSKADSSSTVQVAASSPIRSPPIPIRTTAPPLRNLMAPPGTAYRAPAGIKPPAPKKPVINVTLSDSEGPTYVGSSSDEEDNYNRSNIPPSAFITAAQKQTASFGRKKVDNKQPEKDGGKDQDPVKKLQTITSKLVYNPSDVSKKNRGFQGTAFDTRNRDDSNRSSRLPGTALKRGADDMANAYGGSNRPAKVPRQTGPAMAMPIKEMTLDEIKDSDVRSKVERMQIILPFESVAALHAALRAKNNHEEDALNLLSSRAEVDLTNDVDELSSSQPVKAKPAAKQQIKAPRKNIQDKWAPSQAIQQKAEPKPTSSPIVGESKPRRRLIRGRKGARTPTPEPIAEPEPVPQPAPKRAALSITSDSEPDSALGSDAEDYTLHDTELLGFFNTCTVADLSDLAEIGKDVAIMLISKRPFKRLDEVRRVSDLKKPSKAKTPPKPVGEKIVDKCQEMWAGYASVDELVKTVERLGKPLAEAMKQWGVDVFGKSDEGELNIVNLNMNDVARGTKDGLAGIKKEDVMKDSGLGTPSTSNNVSSDEHSDDEIKMGMTVRNKLAGFFPQPAMMAEGVTLKDYQVVGVNWLSLLFKQKLSCILADDMGLGKTCQVVTFLAHLFEKGEKGPHLIVVPASTLENWLREFSLFCPFLEVMPYYGGINERPETRLQIENNIDRINVVITTYTLAKTKDDNKFLNRLRPCVVVYDEGHYLKNSKSMVYRSLMRINAKFRLLLTGTPLQNNLHELASLLGFILPEVFKEHAENLEYVFNHKATTNDNSHATLLSNQRIERARSMMTPFILRRKKHQVLQHLPAKTRRVEYCSLNPSQQTIYDEKVARVKQILAEREAAKADPAKRKAASKESTHILMELRKASLHPLLFRRHYNDDLLHDITKACLKEAQWRDANATLVYEDLSYMTDFEIHRMCDANPTHLGKFTLPPAVFLDSGKVAALRSLLEAYTAAGARCLVFSQFTMVLDVLEAVLEALRLAFFRLDGATRVDERQDMIDQFYADAHIPVFLLSTKAGGAGINLACANKVVIFDSGFNPQDDVQAENRAHRVGQTREVEVVRLVCRGTIEEGIARLGESKLALDQRVAGEEEEGGGLQAKVEREGMRRLEEMLMKGEDGGAGGGG